MLSPGADPSSAERLRPLSLAWTREGEVRQAQGMKMPPLPPPHPACPNLPQFPLSRGAVRHLKVSPPLSWGVPVSSP